MMTIKIHWPMQRFIVKILAITIAMIVIGAGIGIGHIYAETLSPIYVPGAGWVGTAKTTGNPTAGAKGYATSTTSLYYTNAHIRIWHTGPLLQDEDSKAWYWSTGGSTDTVSSIGYGDYATTRSRFQYSYEYSMVTYYTSDTGAHSCQNAWNTYVNPGC